jgi:predicted O-methyltransferase YrrM
MKPDVFLELLQRGTTKSDDGRDVALTSVIWEEHAMALHRAVQEERPDAVIEIGMGHAISTLAILSALHEVGTGQLTSIDPNQDTDWRSEGRLAVARAGLDGSHRVLAKPDYVALPQMIEEGIEIQFAYVDGWHTVDHVMMDAFYLDKLLAVGGVIAFNDCGFPAVRKAIGYLKTHRHYRQIDVGLSRNYAASTPLKSVARRILSLSHEDRYFRKEDDWTPPWNFYRRF